MGTRLLRYKGNNFSHRETKINRNFYSITLQVIYNFEKRHFFNVYLTDLLCRLIYLSKSFFQSFFYEPLGLL